MTTATDEVRIPPPPPLAPPRLLAVGQYPSSSVDAEDFSRRLGNWGNASQLIGSRWEALAFRRLRARLPWTMAMGGGRTIEAVALLELDADGEAGPALQRAGVSAPDLLLVARPMSASAAPMLRAVDCKVSLDTADPQQTEPVRLMATFDRARKAVPQVAPALRRQVAALEGSEEVRALAAQAVEAALHGRWPAVTVGGGLFVAPENGFNRWFLEQLETRRRTGAPLGRLPASGPRRAASDVSGPVDAEQAARLHLPAHLEPADAVRFLGALPGWPEAQLVAELDGITLPEVDLALAERCWRVGAGLRGAVFALQRRLFHAALPDLRPDGRPREITAGLRQVVARRKPENSAGLVAAVAHSVAARRPLWDREADVLRLPLSFSAWLELAGQQTSDGQTAPADNADEDSGGRRDGKRLRSSAPARALYKVIGARHRTRVLAAAAAREAEGKDEVGVLAALEERVEEWLAAAEADTAELAPALARA